MSRTPVQHKDIVPLIVAALNGISVNSGTLEAKADGSSIHLRTHIDSGAPQQIYEIVVR